MSIEGEFARGEKRHKIEQLVNYINKGDTFLIQQEMQK